MALKALPRSLVVSLLLCAVQSTPAADQSICANISGEYDFFGTVSIDGREQRITFLQRLVRPSRQGVQQVRISGTPTAGQFNVSFLDDSSRVIGQDVSIVATCIDGKWEERRSFDGNSDGTRVKGTRLWKYSLANTGAMVAELEETSSSQHFPGITPRAGSAHNVARFARLP